MVSSSVLGPAVTFRVSSSAPNLTMADVVQAAGKAVSTQPRDTHTRVDNTHSVASTPAAHRETGWPGQSVRPEPLAAVRPPGCRWRTGTTPLPPRQRLVPGEQGSGVCGGPQPPCGQDKCLFLLGSQPVCACLSWTKTVQDGGFNRNKGFVTALLSEPWLCLLSCLQT